MFRIISVVRVSSPLRIRSSSSLNTGSSFPFLAPASLRPPSRHSCFRAPSSSDISSSEPRAPSFNSSKSSSSLALLCCDESNAFVSIAVSNKVREHSYFSPEASFLCFLRCRALPPFLPASPPGEPPSSSVPQTPGLFFSTPPVPSLEG